MLYDKKKFADILAAQYETSIVNSLETLMYHVSHWNSLETTDCHLTKQTRILLIGNFAFSNTNFRDYGYSWRLNRPHFRYYFILPYFPSYSIIFLYLAVYAFPPLPSLSLSSYIYIWLFSFFFFFNYPIFFVVFAMHTGEVLRYPWKIIPGV